MALVVPLNQFWSFMFPSEFLGSDAPGQMEGMGGS